MFGIGSIDRRGIAPGADTAGGWRKWLEARLEQNTAAQAEPWAQGVAITVRSRKPDFMKPPLSWIVPVRKERTYQLDAVGARVWALCGKRLTVEEMVDLFAAEYALSFHEARVLLANYIRDLIQRGIVAIVYKE